LGWPCLGRTIDGRQAGICDLVTEREGAALRQIKCLGKRTAARLCGEGAGAEGGRGSAAFC
jgi:hypothetical protein